MTTVAALLASAHDIEATDARVLLCHTLGVARAWLVAHDKDIVPPSAQQRFAECVARRAAGEPVAYIVGTREFFGRAFKVTPATLVPRPETELLVAFVLEKLASSARPSYAPRILDLGTGSGCIAISLALEWPNAQVTAVDVSAAALAVAQENARALGANDNTSHNAGITWLQSDWFGAFSEKMRAQRWDFIVSNPPYLEKDDVHLANLRFEPASALVAGADGLDDIRRIVARAQQYLSPGGWLAFEHGYNQGEPCRHLLHQAGYAEVFTQRDLAGHQRISGGRIL